MLDALGKAHTRPQAPQCDGSVSRLRHRPAQRVVPVGQLVATQVPSVQVVPEGQMRSQPPQLVLSAKGSTQVLAQLMRPGPHETVHIPREQTRPERHAVLHAPQWFKSVCVLRQTPIQSVSPSRHETWQRPMVQTVPDGHTIPQAPPQRVRVSTSHPSTEFMLQSAKLMRQATSTHAPREHAPTPLSKTHGDPHMPQLFVSLVRLRHAPEQLVRPAPHVESQLPPEQTCPALHGRPHIPQLALSVLRSRHTPEQLVEPVGHETTHTPAVHT